MDFEDYRAAWQNQKFEGYLFDNPPGKIAADISREVQRIERKHVARDFMDIAVIIALALFSAVVVALESSLMARVGTILLVIGFIVELLGTGSLRSFERRKRFDLPWKTFLIEERKQIMEQVRLMKRQATSYALLVLAAAALVCISQGRAAETTLGFITGMLIVLVVTNFGQLKRIKRELSPAIKEFDLELKQYDVIPD